jgi:hypothetical protein
VVEVVLIGGFQEANAEYGSKNLFDDHRFIEIKGIVVMWKLVKFCDNLTHDNFRIVFDPFTILKLF